MVKKLNYKPMGFFRQIFSKIELFSMLLFVSGVAFAIAVFVYVLIFEI